jgi:hypothetical protein
MIGGKKFAVVREKWQNDGQKDERTKIELLPRYFFFCPPLFWLLGCYHSAFPSFCLSSLPAAAWTSGSEFTIFQECRVT